MNEAHAIIYVIGLSNRQRLQQQNSPGETVSVQVRQLSAGEND